MHDFVLRGGAGFLESQCACAISSAPGGCWTAAIKGGVRDIVNVCAGQCWTPAIKRGVRNIVCAWVLDHCNQRGVRAVVWGEILHGEVLDHCHQRGRVRYRLHKCWTVAGGVRDIVYAGGGCWTSFHTQARGARYRCGVSGRAQIRTKRCGGAHGRWTL